MTRVDISEYSFGRVAFLFFVAGAIVLLALAIWPRWLYMMEADLYVDEATTLWASGFVLTKGVPVMPSGALYTRGLLSTYVIAAFTALGGATITVGRLPSVIFGVASVVAVFIAGRQAWNIPVGLVAALGLALLPEMVEASGRARFYAQLVFFVTLTIWFAYRAATYPDEEVDAGAFRRIHLLFAFSFVLALFSQVETVVLYPSLLLGLLMWRGWRYFLKPAAVVAHGICVAAMVARYIVEQLGQLNHFTLESTYKPYFSLSLDLPEAWQTYGHLFTEDIRSLWTILAVLAVIVAIHALSQRNWRLRHIPQYHQATLFFALQFLFVLLVLLTIVGDSWRMPRYALIVQQCWLLVGAAGAVWLIERLTSTLSLRAVATAALATAVVWTMLPRAIEVVPNDTNGYRQAFEYVAAHLQHEDVVMSPTPTVCSLVLGKTCDYYAREDGYLPYVVSRGDALVDIWTGAPLLRNRDELEDVLRRGSRVWLVVDGHRLTTRYDPDTTRTIVEQFSVAYENDNVRALVAEGWTAPPQYTIQRSVDSPFDVGPLTLLGWERTAVRPGEDTHILLLWDEQESIEEQLHTSVQLVAADSLRITQADGPPARGMIWTDERPKYQLPDPKKMRVPSDLEPGVYRLELTAYDPNSETPAADFTPIDWLRVGPEPAAPAIRTDAKWENGVVLQGYDALPSSLPAGQQVPLRLLWTTTDSIDTDYKVFVHLINPDGEIIAQDDDAPMGGFYPTSTWMSGDLIEDHHTVHVPAMLTAGTYTLRIGLYRTDTGERPLRTNGEEAIELASWQVQQ